jgi:hypothetical protein
MTSEKKLGLISLYLFLEEESGAFPPELHDLASSRGQEMAKRIGDLDVGQMKAFEDCILSTSRYWGALAPRELVQFVRLLREE